ncbi:MAG: hypothetical protein IJJ71_09100 [Treponema sp.]|uniref:hypothetical protein n=1 Tax=Treponema sp. TaxID=166 RepID=UPI0025F2A6DA|nr:hypothetical protein [Treponema sp.]MBR0496316.1 hypothetical protein [Treponema sp.]
MFLEKFRKNAERSDKSVKLNFLALKLTLFLPFILPACDFENVLEPTFNDPAKEFFKEYTESAAVMQHQILVPTYNDGSLHLCISSMEDGTVTLFMRNPQRYKLDTTVTFPALDSEIDLSAVTIEQDTNDTLKLTMPVTFLVDADEGKEISPTVHLTEPRSGRNFGDYSFSLFSNTKPPELNNPTVLNESNTTFVVAFDMPSQAELALRHKDLTSISVNGQSYPVSVDADGNFSFSDSAFSTTQKTLIAIGGKTFTYNDRSVYYTTGEPFVEGDKEYSIILADKAGLSSTSLASTKITKLNSPTITNVSGKSIESKYDTDYNSVTNEYKPKSLPLLSGKEYTTVTVTAPTADNLGGAVSSDGLEVHYTLYNGTPKVAKLVKTGTFSGSLTLELEVGSWYLETYATKTNYEKSAKAISYIRVLDSCLFIGENGSDEDTEADGTDALPYKTIHKAIADINKRNDDSVEYTLMIQGNVTGEENTDSIAASGLIITSANSPSSDTLGTFSLTSGIPVTIKAVKVTNLTAKTANNITVSEDAVITTATVQGTSLGIESNAQITEVNLVSGGTLKITGNLKQETAATITPETYANGAKVVADSEYLAANYEKIKVKQNNTDSVWLVLSDGTLIERVKRNITITVIQQEEDIEVTQTSSGNEVTFKLTTTGCSTYNWTVDGTAQTGITDTLVIDTTSWTKGTYDIYLEAVKDSKTYSYHAQITKN